MYRHQFGHHFQVILHIGIQITQMEYFSFDLKYVQFGKLVHNCSFPPELQGMSIHAMQKLYMQHY